ncbi:hypothetical protein [Nocardia aurantia]|uniref:hypothetical protein n=1 Tax=Nocardia aurantia TaxID=2585199 RepID=UPI0012951E27|nr:hypothetical protein [Nocardia aurantia]
MAAETDTTRRWRASIGLGAVLCVGCCLLPPLAAGGFLGGALLAGLSWLRPLGFALLGIGAAGLVWSWHRARRRGCGVTAGGSRDGCVSTGCACTERQLPR